MVVITMTDCPPRIRGDLSKWLCEINVGVYVGQVSSRVREALWTRVCENLKNGRATMVYTTNTEQKMAFRVHNTSWMPVDFDGIQLIRRPLAQAPQQLETLRPGFSHAAQRRMAQRVKSSKRRETASFVVLDLETTGLDCEKDEIIEIAAIRIVNDTQAESFSCLVQCTQTVPTAITKLTGISDSLLAERGISPHQALEDLLNFVGTDRLMGYNISFDMEFLRAACQKWQKPMLSNSCTDLLSMARRKVFGVSNYRLSTLIRHFGLPEQEAHRALKDCELILSLYYKLNENRMSSQ